MIKKVIVITGCVVLTVAMISCSDTRRSPGSSLYAGYGL